MNIIKNGSVDDLERLERLVKELSAAPWATRQTQDDTDPELPERQWTLYSGAAMHAFGSVDLAHEADAVFIARARTELPRIVAELKQRRADHRAMVRLLAALLKAHGGTITISRQLIDMIDEDAVVDENHEVFSGDVTVRLLEPPREAKR